MDRREIFKKMLEKDPDDAFSRYALAMEEAKVGNHEVALKNYAEVVRRDPKYVPAYQMAGQLLMEKEEFDDARDWFEKGVAVAESTGNKKALGEMEDLLNELDLM